MRGAQIFSRMDTSNRSPRPMNTCWSWEDEGPALRNVVGSRHSVKITQCTLPREFIQRLAYFFENQLKWKHLLLLSPLLRLEDPEFF